MGAFQNNHYWKQVIVQIELAAHLKRRKETIRNYDYSVTLPDELRARVKRILHYEFDEYDRNVYIEESEAEGAVPADDAAGGGGGGGGDDEDDSDVQAPKKERKKGVFNESTCSEIVRLDNEFPRFEMKLDTPVQRKQRAKKNYNWCSAYVCKARKDRVRWDSKIYEMERSIWEKTLDEQAEQLMDASAERFTEWINSLGSNHDSDMTKERLKALFSIEGERTLQASIQTEPKEVKAIAKTVADKWNLPEMAIELKYENYIKECLRNAPKTIRTVAFGRTIPLKERPWMPSAADVPIATVFPAELLSGQKLFKGIGHLRSTKALVEFLRKHPNVQKPSYLVRTGRFVIKKETAAKQEVPLYERLKLTY